ncbi:uncharacterized protein CELE_T16H12.9 [Caenorhabditis elegans]|uniref:Uncharacterized protein T16H12.9 n=1 Tax=Caenorhabditis elegans TaxID=6239 RepID=YNV9_CAEEL|nr:Uncharacterized protein CELE_T16H12.9 [Caenorhabditis elegans]P34572.4 RecName: Full=Uncharacterized protein T16H12.9; Flags: Precursor [Caenorhabditis elegans]CAA83142.3 Uncharacterized protein CELE_T16H12.9 [Caenorhabditis elegans]|eukprot:NP_499244.2 Uncharacterized protein CELE_T16H12.9 [Caenorhabditis elegans]
MNRIALVFLYSLFLFNLAIGRVESQTCQCIQPDPSMLNCLGYDSKLQADTIDEAIASFPDLSLNDDVANQKFSTADVGCVTKECQDCRKDMRKQLQKVGLLAKDINDIVASQVDSNSTCTKYGFTRQQQKKSHDDDDDDDDSDSDESKEEEEKKKRDRKHRRDKRQAITQGSQNNTDPNLIGTRFTISCAMKGVSVDPTGTVSLCSSCWVWRQLPSNYRPQYINELVCDNTDSDCLSGYATCSVGHRTFEAIRNDNGVQTQVTLTAGSYCECRISKSSSLQSLVEGTGISGTYNPLSNHTTPV